MRSTFVFHSLAFLQVSSETHPPALAWVGSLEERGFLSAKHINQGQSNDWKGDYHQATLTDALSWQQALRYPHLREIKELRVKTKGQKEALSGEGF